MYIGLPSFFGARLMVVYGHTQHAGLAENVLDHRLNCRTVYINPVSYTHLDVYKRQALPHLRLKRVTQQSGSDRRVPLGFF